MQADGTYMAGINYLPKETLPDSWNYNTGNYFLNLTFLPFLEIAYRCTMFHGDFGKGNNWQQDRSVSLRVRPLKEGRWRPSVVLGSNDVFTTGHLNPLSEIEGNRFFSSIYGVMTKHLAWNGHDFSFSFGGNIPFYKDSYRKGLFGGVCYRPSFFRTAALMVDYDTDALAVGASVCLFSHLSIHLFCYNFSTISGGIRYEFKLGHYGFGGRRLSASWPTYISQLADDCQPRGR